MPALLLATGSGMCENKKGTMEMKMATYVIDYFELPVSSAKDSSAFFTKAFGFGWQAYGDNYIEVRDGGVLGGLNSDGSDKSAAAVVGIRTDDIAAAAKAVKGAGGAITKDTYPYPGGKRFFFREPGGVELMVYQPDE